MTIQEAFPKKRNEKEKDRDKASSTDSLFILIAISGPYDNLA